MLSVFVNIVIYTKISFCSKLLLSKIYSKMCILLSHNTGAVARATFRKVVVVLCVEVSDLKRRDDVSDFFVGI